MTSGSDLLLGLLLGASLAVPPGPMNVWIAAASARSYRAGVATGLAALSADAILAVGVYAVNRAVDLRGALVVLYALGAVVLVTFSWRLLAGRASSRPPAADLRTFSQALVLGLSNPFQVLWWLTAGIAFAYLGGAVLLAGLFGAIAVWILSFPRVVRAGARRSPRIERVVVVASAVTLSGFAAYFAALAVLAVTRGP